MTITIDKNVPPPPERRGAKQYPVDSLGIGESFFAPGVKLNNVSTSYYKPKVFVRRTVTENGVTGVRVWRIE